MKFFKTAITILIVACVFFACSANHKTGTVTRTSSYPAIITKAKKDKTSMSLLSGINLYSVVSVEINESKQQMTVQLNKPDTTAKNTATNVDNSVTPTDKTSWSTGRRVHIYMSDSTSYTLDEPHTIPLNKIAKIETTN